MCDKSTPIRLIELHSDSLLIASLNELICNTIQLQIINTKLDVNIWAITRPYILKRISSLGWFFYIFSLPIYII